VIPKRIKNSLEIQGRARGTLAAMAAGDSPPYRIDREI
jgi:hypothetical protein